METTAKKISTEERLTQEFETARPALSGAGNEYFENLRQEAFRHFQNLGIPDRKNEEWKYTNIRKVFNQGFELQTVGGKASKSLLDKVQIPSLESNTLVISNGKIDWENSSVVEFEVKLLSEAYPENKEFFSRYFSKIARTESSALEALNTALFAEGAFVRIKGNIEKPLHIVHSIDNEKTFINSRIFLALEKTLLRKS